MKWLKSVFELATWQYPHKKFAHVVLSSLSVFLKNGSSKVNVEKDLVSLITEHEA